MRVLQYEIPNTRGGLFLKMKSIGDYLHIYTFGFTQGQFSSIRNSLVLKLTDETIFYGICTPK